MTLAARSTRTTGVRLRNICDGQAIQSDDSYGILPSGQVDMHASTPARRCPAGNSPRRRPAMALLWLLGHRLMTRPRRDRLPRRLPDRRLCGGRVRWQTDLQRLHAQRRCHLDRQRDSWNRQRFRTGIDQTGDSCSQERLNRGYRSDCAPDAARAPSETAAARGAGRAHRRPAAADAVPALRLRRLPPVRAGRGGRRGGRDQSLPAGRHGGCRRARAALLGARPARPRPCLRQRRGSGRCLDRRQDACIGCARCLPACPVDAIIGAARHLHTVLDAQLHRL